MRFLSMLFGLGAEASNDSGRFSYRGPSYHREAFLKHCDQHLRGLIDSYEEQRQESYRVYKRRSRILAIVFLILLGLSFLLYRRAAFDVPLEIFMLSFAFFAVAHYYWAAKPVREYTSSIKNIVFPHVLSFYGDQYRFAERPAWQVSSLKAYDLLPHYDGSDSEDHLVGNYKDVPFQSMELHLTKKNRNSRGGSSETTVFRGIAIQIKMQKQFSGKTLVKKDGGFIGNFLGDKFGSLQRVALEDPVFEKRFEVYSSDQIEARYLLSPSFMERLLALIKVFEGSQLECSFFANSLLILVHSRKNRFEPSSIYTPVTFSEEIATVMNELQELFKVIDTLKLDQHTGL